MKLLNKIKNIIKNIIEYSFEDVSDIVFYIFSNEALPDPLKDDDEKEILLLLHTSQHDFAKAKLIEHNLRLVMYIAKKFETTGLELEDLVSVGVIGLIKAVDSFKIEKNIKLATYASRCIENEILMYLRKVSKTKNEISIDEPLSADSDGNELLLSDILSNPQSNTYDNVELNSEKEFLLHSIEKLNDREKVIMNMRFGLDGKKELTQKQVATKLNISQSYISRLEKKILNKLKLSMSKS